MSLLINNKLLEQTEQTEHKNGKKIKNKNKNEYFERLKKILFHIQSKQNVPIDINCSQSCMRAALYNS